MLDVDVAVELTAGEFVLRSWDKLLYVAVTVFDDWVGVCATVRGFTGIAIVRGAFLSDSLLTSVGLSGRERRIFGIRSCLEIAIIVCCHSCSNRR